MTKRLVVFDPEIEDWLDNRIFDETFARKWPGGLWLSRLSNLAASKSILIETIDHFEVWKKNSQKSILMVMANRISPTAREIISNNRAYAGVCVCLESPLTAFDFYHNFTEYSSWFRHVFAFAGAGTRVKAINTVFHPIVWPYEENKVIPGRPWAERKLLTLINSNRRAVQYVVPNMDIRHPRSSINLFLEYFRVRHQLKNDPWIGGELYLERLSAIKYFSNNPMFDLYGRGWDKPILGVKKEFNQAVQNAYRGEIRSLEKLTVLGQYKFAICFENSSFPGYITEKILDCFVGGCIPIYLGAPNITDYVPKEAFIDFCNFESYQAIGEYIESLTEVQANNFHKAAREFLHSPNFEPFSSNNLALQVLKALEDCFTE